MDIDFKQAKESAEKSQVDYSELEGTLAVLQRINKGIASIRSQQHRDRYRLSLHATTNENNYNHVFYGSLAETVIFIVVALFQVYFVRRWFASRAQKKARSWA